MVHLLRIGKDLPIWWLVHPRSGRSETTEKDVQKKEVNASIFCFERESSQIIRKFLYHNYPHTTIIITFTLQNSNLLQRRKVTFDGALAHRQSLRHLSASDCRRLFDEIKDFLLTLNRFRLRHVSVMVSDTRDVGRGKDDGLKGLWRKYVRGECETSLHDHFTKPQSFYAKSGETEVI